MVASYSEREGKEVWGRMNSGPYYKKKNLNEGAAAKQVGEKEHEKERKERQNLIEPYEKLCKWPLSVFPTQVITEKSSPLEKKLWLNRLLVYFSFTKKHSCCY